MKIRYKIGLFVAALVLIAWFAAELAIDAAVKYVVYREFVDLNDEALARGYELQQDVREFRDDVLRLASDQFGSQADAATAAAARAALEAMQDRERERGVYDGECPLAAIVKVRSDGELGTPAVTAGDDPGGRLLADLASRRDFLVDLSKRHPGEVELSEVGVASLTANETDAPSSAPILWAGSPIAWRPADETDPAARYCVVAALDLRPRMKWLDESSRHLTFVVAQDQRTVLLRPDHGPDRGLNPQGEPLDLSDGTLFAPISAERSVLEHLLRDYQRRLDDARRKVRQAGLSDAEKREVNKEIEQLERRGRLFEFHDDHHRFALADGAGLRYRQWEKWAGLKEEPVVKFNAELNAIMQGDGDPSRRSATLSTDIGRVRIRANSDAGLRALQTQIDAAAERTLGDRPDWEPVVRLQTPVLHVSQVRYDPFVEKRSLWLIQAVTIDEIEGETLGEMTWAVWLQWSSLAALLVAFVFSLNLTRQLERITAAARRLGRADARARDWERTVAEMRTQLATNRRDELGVLSTAFGHMVEEVHRTNLELREERNLLDRRVSERTTELQESNRELIVARDKAEAAKRATDAFVASVSHELRTPLNHIIGFCQLMELTPLDEQQMDDLGKIRGAGQYLLDLINDILDYQKIIMGVLRLELEDVELAPLVEEIAGAMRMKAAENENAVVVDCAPGLGTVRNDPKRLRQILNNLIGNACKFTRKGTVTVSARRESDADGDRITLSVRDTGVGMTPEQQSKLFQPFAKLSEKQGNKDGTGLGLVISRGFCERMGGAIDFESAAGVGTTFSVRIPAQVETDADGATSRPTPVVRPRPATPTVETPAGPVTEHLVLVIDDDRHVQEMMQRFLEARGFGVRTASSGEEGLRLAKQLRPAAITLDALMPNMDGWETLAALKTNDVTARIPVIMVTMVDDRSKGYALGVSDFLVKPVAWDELAAVLQKYDGAATDAEVLVVDDDAQHRSLVRRQLENSGYRVVEAENGQVGLERLAGSRPRLILLDLMMPVMDGFEFVEEVRRDPDLAAIPIIVVTAKDARQEDLDRLNGGVVSVLQKGSRQMDELLPLIHQRIVASAGNSQRTAGRSSQ